MSQFSLNMSAWDIVVMCNQEVIHAVTFKQNILFSRSYYALDTEFENFACVSSSSIMLQNLVLYSGLKLIASMHHVSLIRHLVVHLVQQPIMTLVHHRLVLALHHMVEVCFLIYCLNKSLNQVLHLPSSMYLLWLREEQNWYRHQASNLRYEILWYYSGIRSLLVVFRGSCAVSLKC
jgi:hypothetical protein